MSFHSGNLVFLVGFVLYVGIRHTFERRARNNEYVVNRADGRERMLIAIVAAGSLLLPVLYLFTPWLGFADYDWPRRTLLPGTLLMGLALWLFWRAHADLGANWSMTLQVRKGHQLIRQGVYNSIRHPMYAAIWLFGFAQGLLLSNWLAGWAAVVAFAPMYFLRTLREEAMMCEVFGQEYRDYMRQTGRIFPKVRH
jgi:protein-S-isoprenylcysteine O-methyltransferase Ste14